MFVVLAVYDVEPASADRFRRTFLAHVRTSLGEDEDCLRFDLADDENVPGRFLSWQIFTTKDAFDAHVATRHQEAFERIIAGWVRAKSVETYRLISEPGG